MRRDEMNRVLDEELDHIPRGPRRSAQNLLRAVYRMRRANSLGRKADGDPGRGAVLADAIEAVRGPEPGAELRYDATYFAE